MLHSLVRYKFDATSACYGGFGSGTIACQLGKIVKNGFLCLLPLYIDKSWQIV